MSENGGVASKRNRHNKSCTNVQISVMFEGTLEILDVICPRAVVYLLTRPKSNVVSVVHRRNTEE